ncbi:hypothetical protein NTGHW29_270032 [Candidatus Nitrotoga sp. HW29]|nr:hypothetical protein [Candidatus Nitrotoga sp. HW29]CAH1904283.1 hypothetical protein NTGHW29_270032 [Candidatus Nitrotoga sp. HW29]
MRQSITIAAIIAGPGITGEAHLYEKYDANFFPILRRKIPRVAPELRMV